MLRHLLHKRKPKFHQKSIQLSKPSISDQPLITGKELNEENTILRGTIAIEDHSFDFEFNLTANQLWTIVDFQNVLVHAERRNTTIVDKNIEEVFNDFPPSLVLPNGEIIVGRNKITPKKSIENLPDEIWRKKDWNGFDVGSETFIAEALDKIPVINHTIELLRPSLNEDVEVIVLDDGAHEIADLIWFDTQNSIIHFIHCKAVLKGKNGTLKNPGCRKEDCDVLFAQAMRSIHWISSPILLERINKRINNTVNSQIVFGTIEILETITENYRVNNWRFNIVLVQPGFKIDQVSDREKANNNVYELAIPMYERIIGSNASMEIWGA